MASGRLGRLATFPKLRATWDNFWQTSKRQKTGGVDGITPENFQKDLRNNLKSIQASLIKGYEFSLLRANPIPKPAGNKDRIICIPTVRDRVAQRLVGAYLADRQDQLGIANPASFGFVRGAEKSPRGVQAARNRAIHLRQSFQWAYKSDISAYFDCIPRKELFSIIQRCVATPSLDGFLWNAINCEIDTTNPAIHRKVKRAGIRPGKGVRQGMPLSPFFANILLRNFDKTLLKSGHNLVRYADDFLILCESKKQCESADRKCRQLLQELELEIPELTKDSKTTICAPDQPIEFLGLSLAPISGGGYQLEITKRQIEKIRENLGNLKDIKKLARDEMTIVDVVAQLVGRLPGYRSAYPSDLIANYKLLDDTLSNARSDILTGLLSTIFGRKAIDGLGKWERHFLLIASEEK